MILINTNFLKQLKFDRQKLFRVLTKIVQQFGRFRRKLVDVRRGLVEIVVERFVGDQFADSALAGLRIAEQDIELFGGRIELGQSIAGIFVKFFVFQKFAGSAFAFREIGRDQFEIVGDAVKFGRRHAQIGDRLAGFVVKLVVGHEFAGRSAARADVFGDRFELLDGLIQAVVKRGVVEQLAGAAVAPVDPVERRLELGHRQFRFADGRIERPVKLVVVDDLAERAVALVGFVENLVGRRRDLVDLLEELVAGLCQLVDRDRLRRIEDVIFLDRRAFLRAGRDIDHFIVREDRGGDELGGRIGADPFGDRPFVELAVDHQNRLDLFFFGAVGRQQRDVFDLADMDAGELHLGAFTETVGLRKPRFEPQFFLERVKIAGRIEDQESQNQQPEKHEDADPQLTHCNILCCWHKTLLDFGI
jgi:hypothetical protein